MVHHHTPSRTYNTENVRGMHLHALEPKIGAFLCGLEDNERKRLYLLVCLLFFLTEEKETSGAK